jgi:hypothetical protein
VSNKKVETSNYSMKNFNEDWNHILTILYSS